MSTVYLLQNQDKLILNRNREWTDARDLKSLYQTPHKDEGINQKVEVNAKDYTQRIHLLECELNDKKLPIIAAEAMPEPLPEQPKGEGEQASLIDAESGLSQDAEAGLSAGLSQSAGAGLSQIDSSDIQDPREPKSDDDTDVAELEADEQAEDVADEFDQDTIQD
ncbi:hypothetical protein QWY82_03595 [Simiduia curdlanivorans]|uniref:Uncharacterized protein n=1 Tax=Simiduia curdlanivorans TaxID=1492769 RepID=A0ABV8V030_9GAMM|nr:hypothetical protein [Simiduia curdlanivorans]MDN3637886.1 hypothetical protein [Simiduia curdlanivorans]